MTQDRLDLIQNIHKDHKIDEIVYCKYQILQRLYQDPDLFEVLHNTELEEQGAIPEDYKNVNIFSFMRIPDTQSTVKNFVCFEVDDTEPSLQNNMIIKKVVRFRTISHKDDIETGYGIDRQDLLAMIIKDLFNWSTLLNMQMKKVYDKGYIAENGYYYRDIHYVLEMANSPQRGTTNNFKYR